MFSNKLAGSSKQLAPIGATLVILAACVSETRGQRPRQPARDLVRAIEQKEMDQMLLRKPLPALSDEPARQAVLKQIREDFRDLQSLNNRMMSDSWAREAMDYDFVSDMVSRIRGKATRLKGNLNLPEPDRIEKDQSRADVGSAADFRAALLTLDRTIMRFVTNPLFQTPNAIDVSQATQARKDLEAVIGITGELKKVALRLSKLPHGVK